MLVESNNKNMQNQVYINTKSSWFARVDSLGSRVQ